MKAALGLAADSGLYSNFNSSGGIAAARICTAVAGRLGN
jgi:hypothetical protein